MPRINDWEKMSKVSCLDSIYNHCSLIPELSNAGKVTSTVCTNAGTLIHSLWKHCILLGIHIRSQHTQKGFVAQQGHCAGRNRPNQIRHDALVETSGTFFANDGGQCAPDIKIFLWRSGFVLQTSSNDFVRVGGDAGNGFGDCRCCKNCCKWNEIGVDGGIWTRLFRSLGA